MTPYGKMLKIYVPKVFIATPIDVWCLNFVKFGRREIGEIVRCLADIKISPDSPPADRAQNLPGPATDNVLRVLQILSKSVCRPCVNNLRRTLYPLQRQKRLNMSL